MQQANLKKDWMVQNCPYCSAAIQSTIVEFCQNCGRNVRDAAAIAEFQKKSAAAAQPQQAELSWRDIAVTTGDIKASYSIIGPVYFQVSNKGILSSALSKYAKQYKAEIAHMRSSGQMSRLRADWGFLYGEFSAGQNDFEMAFFIAVQELKKRAALVGGNAIVSMRQDIDMDTTGFQFFYLQMYGTAVRVA